MRSWAPPTAKELDRLAVLCARPETRAYFFDRLENPNWVNDLAQRRFFANPPDPVPAEEPGYMRFPPWPEGRYLARVAAEAPAAVASVLQNIPASENPAVTGLLFFNPGCLKSSSAGEAAQQQPGHGQVDDRLGGGGQVLVVLAEPPKPAQPGEGPLHHPPPWDHGERRHDRRRGTGRQPAPPPPTVAALHHLEVDAAALGRPVQERAAVAGIGPSRAAAGGTAAGPGS
jgi:hypothetical protein